MRSSKTKHEMDTWSGHVGVVRVMNMLDGGMYIKTERQCWNEVDRSDETNCQSAP